MTDLKFFQEFLRRFNLENEVFVETNNYSIAYEVLLRNITEDEEKGLLTFTFERETGKYIDSKPYLSDAGEANLEEQLKAMDYNETINTIRFLLDELQDNF